MSEEALPAAATAVVHIEAEEIEAFSNDPAFLDPPAIVEPELRPKRKGNRHRLLRGRQQVSSSPSLARAGRARSSSSPYHGPGSFSCVSLAASSTSPFGQLSPGYLSTSSHGGLSTAPTSIPGTPGQDSYFDGVDHVLGARKVTNLDRAASSTLTVPLPAELKKPKKAIFNIWEHLPREIKIQVLGFLQPRDLVLASAACREFHDLCFDGQLWTSFDASEFYRDIPAESLAQIIVAAGPFVKDLNLRGCVQVEHYKRAEVIVKACKNLINATLEGCRNLQRTTLHSLVRNNDKLAHLNLTGLTAVTNTTCKLIAQSCPSLELLNVSWCKHMDAEGVKAIVEACPKLKDLRAGEIKGFDDTSVALAIFKTNNLERLLLTGCDDLDDQALSTMIYGTNPVIDILTDRPIVPPRKLRHLDLSRCKALTSNGVEALGHFVPNLEGLSLAHCAALTDAALEPILSTTPRLTHLDLEDCRGLTNRILSEHLAKSPCAPNLEHLCISSCEDLGDSGMLPVIRSCGNLQTAYLDNTRVSDLVLAEAASMIRRRSKRTDDITRCPQIGLSMAVYDCQHVSWTGVREVLSRNAEIKSPLNGRGERHQTYPTEVIALKCFYGWQMTVDEHTKRVLRGDLAAANRLERKWADYMQANEEAGAAGAGGRRRRRRAREAQMAHADEEEGGAGVGGAGAGRRRARTAACVVM
ncbi:F-box/LRR-repeat protein 2 [Cytospora mali]|uniref:F-box/LRR-repeat protein 2 n=1 Tax=Cytospora mali TaxID=578113 RepID=A0A194VKT7_CYTMA|nr:F-box/LRR-repeat protein 2 [Valsa mali]